MSEENVRRRAQAFLDAAPQDAGLPATGAHVIISDLLVHLDRGRAALRQEIAAEIRAASPATLKILPASHTGEVVLIDLAERYAQMVEGVAP